MQNGTSTFSMHPEQIGKDGKCSSINSAETNEADDLELAWQVV
jgi:hypothetical protein